MQLCTTYKEVSSFHGKTLRHYARNGALEILSTLNKRKYREVFHKPRIQFLYFHHIFTDEENDFEQLVAKLSKSHTFISHSEAVERLSQGEVDKPYVSWSSDDGFKNNLVAARILEKHGASCCFFVNPGSIGLSDEHQIQKFCNEKLIMPPTAFLTWNEVDTLLNSGHEIGSHTMRHDLVADLSLPDFKEDLKQSKNILEKHCGTIKHFAYPYGGFDHFNKNAFDAVFEAGYESCSSAVRGCHISDGSQMAKKNIFIRRDQVVAAWPNHQIEYFMYNNFINANYKTNTIPESYRS